MIEQNKIRNFCIIAHIDHGKSTLADRFLEMTGTIASRNMKKQVLDQMDLEQERGITIKLAPASMEYDGYILNLIDTPGHVDFNYEVSRSLAAVEGALLLVDATQGVQAQTLGNLYLALEQDLTIIPVINKIDLPNAQIEKTKEEIINLIGCSPDDIFLASGKTGEGVEEILKAVIRQIPAPQGSQKNPLRALIFDSEYDEFKGVIAYARIIDGVVASGDNIYMMATEASSEVLETGIFNPEFIKRDNLGAGQIGYIVTGLKDIDKCRVGDTITFEKAEVKPLKGYKEVKPMVFAGIFAKEGRDYERLREALLKLKLNDAALLFEPEQSQALGFGFRCGFLGLLHLEIVGERLKREYNLDIIITTPSVAYKVHKTSSDILNIKSPQELPDQNLIDYIEEPWVKLDIITPKDYIGNIMQLVQDKRGEYKDTEYLSVGKEIEDRVILHYEIPLASVIVDFYDKLKSVSSGYASLNYEFVGYRRADVERLDILVAGDPVEALSTIVYKDELQRVARKIVKSLKETLPRQMFEIKVQATVGLQTGAGKTGPGTIVASEKIPAYRKDVTAKLYGGDVTRKRKLLEKQKKGKKKMKEMGIGKVDIPPEAFMSVLKR